MLSTVSLLSCRDSEPQTTPVFHKVTIINLAVDNLNVEIMFVKKVFPRPGLLTKKIFQCSHRRQDPIPESPGGWHLQWGQSTGVVKMRKVSNETFPEQEFILNIVDLHVCIYIHTAHIHSMHDTDTYTACMYLCGGGGYDNTTIWY